jgi:hypothetical protein
VGERQRSVSFAVRRQLAAMGGLSAADVPWANTPRILANQAIAGIYGNQGFQGYQGVAQAVSEETCWIRGCELAGRKDDPDGLCLPHRTNVDSWREKT